MNQSAENVDDSSSSSGIGIYIVGALIAFVPFFLILFPVFIFMAIPFGDDESATIDPTDAYHQLTGWELPHDASIVMSKNTHRGMKNDGDYVLAVHMRPSELQAVLKNDSNEWRDCPVDPEIVASAWDLPDHSGTKYYARKTFDSDSDWHRGHVVIVNPETGFVWVYEWKN